MADIAHIAGLVAAGLHPSPVPHCHFVTSTTHKTLRGPRGGLILCGADWAEAIDKAVFPGIQGGPLMHTIAAKAVAFAEALEPGWKGYQKQVIANSAALCQAIAEHGWRIVSGGTDNHLFLIDLGADFISGKKAERWLGLADITVNKNTVPFDTRKPYIASGLRIGTPAVTTRGMGVDEMKDHRRAHRPGAQGRRGHRGRGEAGRVRSRDGGRQGRGPRADGQVPVVLISRNVNRPTPAAGSRRPLVFSILGADEYQCSPPPRIENTPCLRHDGGSPSQGCPSSLKLPPPTPHPPALRNPGEGRFAPSPRISEGW